MVLSKGQDDDHCTISDSYGELVIDSIASCHVIPRNEFFTSYEVRNFGRVKMCNDNYANIMGIGDICVRANTGYTLTFKDERHVLDIYFNLISTHGLDKEGYKNYFRDGKWRLTNRSLVFVRGKFWCTFYKTQLNLCNNVISVAQEDSLPNLWHRRLAHMSEKW